MAGVETHRWKLGLFVILGVMVLFVSLVFVGAGRFDRPSLPFVTYFNEAVHGLDVGSKVKFRGVPIGEVTGITIAPDRKRVQVDCKVYLDDLDRLGLSPPDGEDQDTATGPFVPEDLRVQLVSASLATGQLFLQVNFFDPSSHPRPGLPFPTPPNYIPSTESTIKGLGELVDQVSREFPDLVRQVKRIMTQLQELLADVDAKGISQRTTATLDEARALLDRADGSLESVEGRLDRLDLEGLSQSGKQGLEELSATLSRARRLVERVEKEGGMLEDLEHTARGLRDLQLQATVDEARSTVAAVRSTSRAVTDLARDARDGERELEEALRSLRAAADSVKRLADTLEQDSDMLLKGRARRDR